MESGGGTQIWCYKCDALTKCKVLFYNNDSKGNFSSTDFKDLHWRARPRECNRCGAQFTTYEINDDAVEELMELRKLVIEMKSSIEKQIEAPTSIDKLIKNLASK